MTLSLRKLLFWPHLVAGLLAGLIIFLLCLTGLVLVFERPVVAWADDSKQGTVPAGAPRLTVEALVANAQRAQGQERPSAITVFSDPASAVQVGFGREGGVYVDPYSGEVRPLGAPRARAFFHWVTDLHRFLLGHGDSRPVGKAITGAANLGFLFLGLTGLYLWFPRKWAWRAYRPALWFRNGLRGKAREFSWHNVIGLWSLPVLLVLTISGAVISYGWASNAVYRLAGETPPVGRGPGGPPPPQVTPPSEGATAASWEAQFAAATAAVPGSESTTLRLAAPGRGEPQATSFSVRLANQPPQRATVQVVVDPFTAGVLSTQGYAEASAGRRARMWLRFLHTGEALGIPGLLLAGLACLGGCFLVYTGISLSLRRYVGARRRARAGANSGAADLSEPARGVPGTPG